MTENQRLILDVIRDCGHQIG
ncbi:hypothetical protein LCGC14_2881020, partial [marine sediment metagenome]